MLQADRTAPPPDLIKSNDLAMLESMGRKAPSVRNNPCDLGGGLLKPRHAAPSLSPTLPPVYRQPLATMRRLPALFAAPVATPLPRIAQALQIKLCRQAHNLKVGSSNLPPATTFHRKTPNPRSHLRGFLVIRCHILPQPAAADSPPCVATALPRGACAGCYIAALLPLCGGSHA